MAVDAVVTKADGFGYGGRRVFVGEIIRMLGLPNDGKLVQIGYLTRYDASAHDKESEVEANGRRFISPHHHASFLSSMADLEERSLARDRFLGQDQTQAEYVAIERAGLRVHEQQGDTITIPTPANLPKMASCPIDGCSLRIPVDQLREHVESHEGDINADQEQEVAAKPKATRRVAAKPAAKKSVRRAAASRA